MLLFDHFGYGVEGFHLYRGRRLPKAGQIISVESRIDPKPPRAHTARVMRLSSGEAFSIRAVEVEPEQEPS